MYSEQEIKYLSTIYYSLKETCSFVFLVDFDDFIKNENDVAAMLTIDCGMYPKRNTKKSLNEFRFNMIRAFSDRYDDTYEFNFYRNIKIGAKNIFKPKFDDEYFKRVFQTIILTDDQQTWYMLKYGKLDPIYFNYYTPYTRKK